MSSGEREALVLLPGLSCDRRVWQDQIADLSDIAHIIVGDTLQDDSMAAMASRILETAPERFAMAGFSMGGYVAQEILQRAPERVTRIAFIDTNAGGDSPKQAELREAAIRTARERGFEHVLRGSRSQLVAPETSNEIFEQVVRMALRVGFATYMDQQAAIASRQDAFALLETVSIPALVLVGAMDALTPPFLSQKMAEIIPGAIYEEIAGAGHMAPMESPQAVNAALRRWLAMEPASAAGPE